MTNPSVRAALSQLSLASKLLLASVLVQSLFFLCRAFANPGQVFNVVWAASVVLCIAGFVIANYHLGFTAEASDFTQPRLLIGRRAERKARLSIALFFYGAFLVPFLNALIALWAYFRIRAAVNGVEKAAREAREADARRRKMFGPMTPPKGGADTVSPHDYPGYSPPPG